ncbi:hypothetical protein BO85DRAFT_228803 [Aspergillus piperis CBS 112811]|uniref:Uncharacterized protein n=1 Tax=Aspergillus piperis CBS 112811 TaxID=1448313 RepID=A0A8G1RBZ2_9EURO|nr:hypothetical protein BO85DRAFT_228803 [Aspergillus piperis CBS 112811]RAH60490.1 hypothetical protein BO85DRAFT_228803 [Aspergillus piperis CBS 112811]
MISGENCVSNDRWSGGRFCLECELGMYECIMLTFDDTVRVGRRYVSNSTGVCWFVLFLSRVISISLISYSWRVFGNIELGL